MEVGRLGPSDYFGKSCYVITRCCSSLYWWILSMWADMYST
jgi:hypothetical protein